MVMRVTMRAVSIGAFRAGAVCFGTLCSSAALAQRIRIPTDSLVRGALHRAEAGDTATALELLEQATDQSPRDPEALYWRGVVLSRTTGLTLGDTPRRMLAWRLLNRAAGIDAKNPRYLMELGRIRLHTPLTRVEAERLFKRALDVADATGDPGQVAEAAYELGQIKERRYNSGRDRWLYTANLVFDPLTARRRVHYTREFLDQLARPLPNAGFVDRTEAEEYYRRALVALPTHGPSAIGLLGVLYEQKRYDEMRTVAAPLTRSTNANPRMLLADGLAAYRQGQLREADRLFARALAALPPDMRAEALDLGRIVRSADAARLAGLSETARAQTDSAFWEAADPMLSTPVNEARLEFLARMAYADLRFTDADTKQVGWRTDRAVIVARYGEPPVVATFAPTTDADAREAIGRVITVWFYPRAEVEFVFAGPPAMNIAQFAGNYRDFAEERRDMAPFMLDNVPLALAVDSLPTQIARFRGTTARETQLVVAVDVPTRTLYREAEIDRGALELSLRVGPPSALALVAADTQRIRLPTATSLRQVWIDTVRTGDYRVRVEARDAAVASAVSRAHVELSVPAFGSGTLESSDILIADRADPPTRAIRSWTELDLRPRGTLTIAPRDTFTVYWENYGLRADANQRVKFDVRFVVTLLKLDRGDNVISNLFGSIADAVGLSAVGDAQLGMRFERDEALGGRDRVPGVVTLGMGTAPPGRYRLEIFVMDHTSGQRTQTQREFTIQRP